MCKHDSSAHGQGEVKPSIAALRSHFDFPDTPLCNAALERAHRDLQGPIFNHSFRVFLYADWLSKGQLPSSGSSYFDKQTIAHERELLFVACLYHDMGTIDALDGDHRFEVEGANAAVALVRAHQSCLTVDEASLHQVWLSIALHTSSGLAEQAGRLSLVVRSAVLLDFKESKRVEMQALEQQTKYEAILPRAEPELVLALAVARQAAKKPGKAPLGSWPQRLLVGYNEDLSNGQGSHNGLLASF